jgi:site-specific DNA-methyltransferase (cytosine-N4-specific)
MPKLKNHSHKHAAQVNSKGPLTLHDIEQLYFWKQESVPLTKHELASDHDYNFSSIGCDQERKLLENNYGNYFDIRFDFRRLVTYVLNKNIPVYNWFKFKEGFSRELVFRLLKELNLKKDEIVFDPFAGCGTTLLACKEFGYPAIGLEILPVAVYVARVKLLDWPDLDILFQAIEKLLQKPIKKPKGEFPNVPIIEKAFPKNVQEEILFYKEEILEFDTPVRDFLMLGLISILEHISYTSKDGQFLRLVDRKIPPVKNILRKQLSQMLADLCQQEQFLFKDGQAKVQIFEGDAREPCIPSEYWVKIAAVITSPPYLNRYDYSRTYALELCTISVETFDEMRKIRQRLLRSHIESKKHTGREINIPVVDEILHALAQKNLNNNRIPIMIRGYFEDMNLVIENLSRYLKKEGKVAVVVANAQFEGEYVPTDLILCELAKQHGLLTERIWVTRFKGNSSQQMAKYGRRPVRETIVFWRKNTGAES